jgi:hypothetical protein
MPTPTGTISLNDVNIELGRSSGSNINMNDSAVRTLAGVGGSGTVISMNDLRGKSSLTVNYPDSATGSFFGSDYCGSADVQVDAPSISGGNGTYSYSWQRISASAGIAINSSTVQRPIWSTYICNDAASETWRVTVTSGSTSVTDDVNIYLSYFTL